MTQNFDFEIIETNGREALSKVLELRRETEYPFIIGDEKSLSMLTEIYEFSKDSARQIIDRAAEIDVESLFAKLKKDSLPVEEETDFDIAALTGDWQDGLSASDIGLSWDDQIRAPQNILTGHFYDKCFVGIAPASESWQVPAFARYGAWNDCPKAEEHCAILRYWQHKYGAEIISLTGDVIECRVRNSPQTEQECWNLAWQQFAYCSDIVYQGVGTVGTLASGLRDSGYWYFWWD